MCLYEIAYENNHKAGRVEYFSRIGVRYYKDTNGNRIDFHSFGQVSTEVQRYPKDFQRVKMGCVIQRNTDIIQAANTHICGYLCLFVLQSLAHGLQCQTFLIICNTMIGIHKVIGKIPFKPKRGFVLLRHRYTGPLHKQLDFLPGQEPHNAVNNAISMHYDICYRDERDS